MVSENMPHHENAIFLGRQPHKFLALPDFDGQRLLDKDIFSCFQGHSYHVIVGHSRGGERHSIYSRIQEDFLIVAEESDVGILLLHALLDGSVCITDGGQGTKLSEIPY